MKRINLNKGSFVWVDNDDFDFLNQWEWRASYPRGGHVYAIRSEYKTGKHVVISMHRVITNCPDGMVVDHKDRNGLNNRKTNLRICTRSQNACNRRKNIKTSTTKYLGIYYNSKIRKWCAAVGSQGKVHNLGKFKTQKEAAKCYNEGAIKFHGEFARLNKV